MDKMKEEVNMEWDMRMKSLFNKNMMNKKLFYREENNALIGRKIA